MLQFEVPTVNPKQFSLAQNLAGSADQYTLPLGGVYTANYKFQRLYPEAVDAFDNAGYPLPDPYLDAYASAAQRVAEADLGAIADLADPSDMAELMVVGTVLGDTLSSGLRRIAQAFVTTERRIS